MQPINYLSMIEPLDTNAINGLYQTIDQHQQRQAQQAAQEAAAQKQAQFQADMQDYINAPNPQKAATLISRYPQMREALGDTFKTMDGAQKKMQQKAGAQLTAALNSGNHDLALSMIDKNISALGANNPEAETYHQMRDMVKTDPKGALANIGLLLSAEDPEAWGKMWSGQKHYYDSQKSGIDVKYADENAQLGILDTKTSIAQKQQAMAIAREEQKYKVQQRALERIDDPTKSEKAALDLEERRLKIEKMRNELAVPIKGSEAYQMKTSQKVLGLVDEADKYLKQSTASGLGNIIDHGAAMIGKSTKGAQAAAQLQTIAGQLVMAMPRMEGAQSDKDTELYREMAGRIGDAKVPVATRQAALSAIRSLNEKYATQQQQPTSTSLSNPSNGWQTLPNGVRVRVKQ